MAETLINAHDGLATTVLLYFAAVGVWGLFSFYKGQVLGGSIAGALVIGQVLAVVQALLGAAIYLDDLRPESSTHYLYGASSILALPFVWTYMKERDARQALLFYSLISLFIAGLAVRAMATGG